MTFAEPFVLIGLLAVLGLGGGLVVRERQRRRAMTALVTPALATSVAPRRPRWRHLVPELLLVLALAALVLAAAGPRRSVRVPVRGTAFLLANDVSNSMEATDVRPSRLGAARAAASRFAAELPSAALVGQMAFARHPEVLQSPTTDRTAEAAAIGELAPGGGGTAIGATIITGLRLLGRSEAGGRRPPAAIVLLSDGGSNVGPSPVAAARRARVARIPVDTVALGTPDGEISERRDGRRTSTAVPVARAGLAAIAAASGGRAFSALTGAQVERIYAGLAATLGRRRVQRNLDLAFAGGALTLLAVSGALSLTWFHRLI